MLGFLERKAKQKKKKNPMQQKGSERHLEMEGIVCKCEAHGVRRKVSQDREGTGCQSSIHRAFTADLGHMETTDCPISSSDWKR